MKNAMQLKALVKNLAIAKGVAPQALQQNYMLERILAMFMGDTGLLLLPILTH